MNIEAVVKKCYRILELFLVGYNLQFSELIGGGLVGFNGMYV